MLCREEAGGARDERPGEESALSSRARARQSSCCAALTAARKEHEDNSACVRFIEDPEETFMNWFTEGERESHPKSMNLE